jgi:hypothetical protein
MQLKPVAALVIAVLALTAGGAGAESLQATAEQRQHHLELFRKGAALWPVYCNHCHNARNPAEFAPYQWDQILMHMRTMENMPIQDADAILEFLKTAR